MYISLLFGFIALLSTTATTLALPTNLTTTTTTTTTSANSYHPILPRLATCPTSHLPTKSQYQMALSQYCAHFPAKLSPQTRLVYTYRLRDAHGHPIKWILSTTWDNNDSNGASGGKPGTMTITGETCRKWFSKFLEGECVSGGSGVKMVQGGKRNVMQGHVKGMEVWVETRRRKE